MMKKIILAAICALPMVVMAQKPFSVKGRVGALNAPAKVYLSYRIGATNVVDSTDLKNGSFEFKGQIDGISSATLRLKHAIAPVVAANPKQNAPQDQIQFYLEPTKISVVAADSMKFAKVTGSKANADNAKLAAMLKPLEDKLVAIIKEYYTYTAAQKNDKAFMKLKIDKFDSLKKELVDANAVFAAENTDSYVGLVAFGTTLGTDIDVRKLEPLFLTFPESLRNTTEGKNYASRFEAVKRSQIGVVTDFTQNDPDGKPVKLSDFKGKYVLVDFWASWCGPCRAENPNVVVAFNKLKDKNFTIIGVSLDGASQKDAWLKAVKDDGLTWTQVSDLKGGKNEVAIYYDVKAIPFNFLVDPAGKIVARNLRGVELHKKLEELLGQVRDIQ